MIITTNKIICQKGKRKEIVQTIKGLVEQLIQEEGCVNADLYQDLDDKDILYFTEEWQTKKALENYKTSKSLAVLLGLETLLAESLEIKQAVKLEKEMASGREEKVRSYTNIFDITSPW